MFIDEMSDLHLEWPLTEEELKKAGELGPPDVLILAGDLNTRGGKSREQVNRELRLLVEAKRPKYLIAVPGNHDYYKTNLKDAARILKGDLDHCLPMPSQNIYVLNNESVVIEDVRFMGTTLWSNLEKIINDYEIKLEVEKSFPDYSRILKEGSKRNAISLEDTHLTHLNAVEWLKIALDENSSYRKNVVITHHSPTFNAVESRFLGDKWNPLFHSDLYDLIKEKGPDLWYFGHIHNAYKDQISNTKLSCNPRGYPSEYGINGFDIRARAEV